MHATTCARAHDQRKSAALLFCRRCVQCTASCSARPQARGSALVGLPPAGCFESRPRTVRSTPALKSGPPAVPPTEAAKARARLSAATNPGCGTSTSFPQASPAASSSRNAEQTWKRDTGKVVTGARATAAARRRAGQGAHECPPSGRLRQQRREGEESLHGEGEGSPAVRQDAAEVRGAEVGDQGAWRA